jgi:hypothetical protein
VSRAGVRRDDGTCWTCAKPRCLGWFGHEWARLRNSFTVERGYFAGNWSWLRATFDRHVLRYNLEHCQRCGRRVGLSWWSVTGWEHVVRDGGCIRCIKCFNREAWAAEQPVCWLAVSFDEFDRQVGEYFVAYREGIVR